MSTLRQRLLQAWWESRRLVNICGNFSTLRTWTVHAVCVHIRVYNEEMCVSWSTDAQDRDVSLSEFWVSYWSILLHSCLQSVVSNYCCVTSLRERGLFILLMYWWKVRNWFLILTYCRWNVAWWWEWWDWEHLRTGLSTTLSGLLCIPCLPSFLSSWATI